jgi:hypothetical protein
MSAENKLKTAAGLSCVWDGETIKRVRSGDGVTILSGRRVSLHLMVQPGVAAIMLSDPELADQGMLSRCLVTAPESRSGYRFFREPAPETKNRLMEYERRLHEILQRKLPLAANTRNVLAPRFLRLSTGATNITVYGGYANRLLKLQSDLLKTLDRRRKRGSSQSIEVKHVHIHAGGQGVIGIVNHDEGQTRGEGRK